MANKLIRRLGTAVVAIVMLGGGVLVAWNIFGQGPYGDSCRFSLGCRSFYCLHHAQQGSAQITAPGHCTKSCDSDADCVDADITGRAVCVTLGDAARDDLPPFGKPEKACMIVQDLPPDIRH